MDLINNALTFVQSNPGSTVLAGLLLISEGLASIPSLQPNSILQAVILILKKLTGK